MKKLYSIDKLNFNILFSHYCILTNKQQVLININYIVKVLGNFNIKIFILIADTNIKYLFSIV